MVVQPRHFTRLNAWYNKRVWKPATGRVGLLLSPRSPCIQALELKHPDSRQVNRGKMKIKQLICPKASDEPATGRRPGKSPLSELLRQPAVVEQTLAAMIVGPSAIDSS